MHQSSAAAANVQKRRSHRLIGIHGFYRAEEKPPGGWVLSVRAPEASDLSLLWTDMLCSVEFRWPEPTDPAHRPLEARLVPAAEGPLSQLRQMAMLALLLRDSAVKGKQTGIVLECQAVNSGAATLITGEGLVSLAEAVNACAPYEHRHAPVRTVPTQELLTQETWAAIAAC